MIAKKLLYVLSPIVIAALLENVWMLPVLCIFSLMLMQGEEGD